MCQPEVDDAPEPAAVEALLDDELLDELSEEEEPPEDEPPEDESDEPLEEPASLLLLDDPEPDEPDDPEPDDPDELRLSVL